jgi:hypothetical protein
LYGPLRDENLFLQVEIDPEVHEDIRGLALGPQVNGTAESQTDDLIQRSL